MPSLNLPLSSHCVPWREQPLQGRRHLCMGLAQLPSLSQPPQTWRSVSSHPFTKPAHLSVIHCSSSETSTCHSFLPTAGFPTLCHFSLPTAGFPALWFSLICSRSEPVIQRESFLQWMGWGWGKTRSFVTWAFWGTPLPQDPLCWCHKCLCHPALPMMKTHTIFLPFRSPSFSSN